MGGEDSGGSADLFYVLLFDVFSRLRLMQQNQELLDEEIPTHL